MGMKHTSIANHILLGVTLLSLNTIVQIVDSTAEQSNVYHKYLHGEGHAARVNGRFSKSLAAAFENSPRFSKSLAQEFDNSPPQHSKSIEEDVLSHRSARVNSRRFSKSWEEELDNSTVQAVENNTVEENMEASSTATTDAVSYYPSRNEKPSGKVEEENTRTPGGTAGTSVKPTKYHYYPHNQHIYLLPECAVQQVCNAVYVRLNYTQPLCACPSRYREPCSASINSDDFHTTELTTDPKGKVLTLVKTCEPVLDMRLCRSPRDWSLLALQNIRTGKSHYLVICRCPDSSVLEGPMSHDQPTYASVPGIRVYGMMCVTRPTGATPSTPSLIASTTLTTYRSPAPVPSKRKSRPLPLRVRRSLRKRFYEKQDPEPAFPWDRVSEMLTSLQHQEDYAHQGQVVNVQ